MNKILLNNKGRNHIKFLPMKNTLNDIPADEGDKIRLCKQLFDELQNSSKTINLFMKKDRHKGYQISLWELDDLYYLAQSMRNEFGTYNNVIYITKEKGDAENIAKFLSSNIRTIMNDYKKQIIDAKEFKINDTGAKA